MRAVGHVGELRYGYQVAARLGAWTMERVAPGYDFRLQAEILQLDQVWMAYRPLDLIVALGQVEWVWRNVEPTVIDGRAQIRLQRRPDAVGERLAQSA